MKDLLKQAFTLASRGLTTVSDKYDKAGFYVWRGLMDDTFLTVDPLKFESPTLRRAAETCDWVKEQAVKYVYKDLLNKGATGDVGPKPNYKPVLLKAFEAAAPHLSRIQITSPAVMALTLGVATLTAYGFSHSGSNHVVPDMVATWYGANAPARTAPPPS